MDLPPGSHLPVGISHRGTIRVIMLRFVRGEAARAGRIGRVAPDTAEDSHPCWMNFSKPRQN